MSFLSEFKYWQVTRRIQKFRPWLAQFYPKWLITDSLIHAGVRKIRKDETVPEVSFMDVYGRWYDEGRRRNEAVNVYEVGFFRDVRTLYRRIKYRNLRRYPFDPFKPFFRSVAQSWKRKSYWNGFLVEPLESGKAKACGRGWTKGLAFRSLEKRRVD
jgi:hypothetical protein